MIGVAERRKNWSREETLAALFLYLALPARLIDDKGEAHYDMNADDFARHTKHLVEVGAGIGGGFLKDMEPRLVRRPASSTRQGGHG